MRRQLLWLVPVAACAVSCSSSSSSPRAASGGGGSVSQSEPAPPRAQDDAVAAASGEARPARGIVTEVPQRPSGQGAATTRPTTQPGIVTPAAAAGGEITPQPQRPQEEVTNPKSLVRPAGEKP